MGNWQSREVDRRAFVRGAFSTAGVVVLTGCATASAGTTRAEASESGKEPEVTPGEDLMQEHGLLERILLIYDEASRRIHAGATFDPAAIVSAARMMRTFVEDYHERQEEQFIFPRLTSADRERELVATLLKQHRRGRELTEEILTKASASDASALAPLLQSFTRMYRPHAAREDTVLFPAFREVIGRSAYAELGEQFEDKEHELFGKHGFENNVAEVAKLEASLGIADLASFTP